MSASLTPQPSLTATTQMEDASVESGPQATSSSHTNPTPANHSAKLQRSFTLPARLANNPRHPTRQAATAVPAAVNIGASDAIETLYAHPGARIISFSATASGTSSRPSSSSSVRPLSGSWYEGTMPHSPGGFVSPVGASNLPWSNATERTLAVGPLEIYRVPGSVSFLHSGTLLHAILPRSQCWCVDGVSKFVLRVRPDTYYRIELPGSTEEELEYVQALKTTLAQVLYYERTACPFQRGFGEELPEMPDLPRRSSSRPGSAYEPAKRWTFGTARRWKPEGAADDDDEETETEGNRVRIMIEPDTERNDQHSLPPASPLPLRVMRSTTAPPQLSLNLLNRTPSKTKVPQIAGRINEAVRSHETQSSLLTPVRRRQRQADAPTPKLPPTPESMHDEFPHDFPSEQEEDESSSQTGENKGDKGQGSRGFFDQAIAGHPTQNQNIIQSDEQDQSAQGASRDYFSEKPESSHNQQEETSLRVAQAQASIDPNIVHQTIDPKQTISNVDLTSLPGQISHHYPTTTISKPIDVVSPDPSALASTHSSSSLESWASLPPPPGQGDNDAASLAPSSSSYQSLPSITLPPPPTSAPLLSTNTATTLSSKQRAAIPSSSTSAFNSSTSSAPSSPNPLALNLRGTTATRNAVTTTGSLVTRTAQIFLAPPAHLVQLMLRIAARILLSALQDNNDNGDGKSGYSYGHGYGYSYDYGKEKKKNMKKSDGDEFENFKDHDEEDNDDDDDDDDEFDHYDDNFDDEYNGFRNGNFNIGRIGVEGEHVVISPKEAHVLLRRRRRRMAREEARHDKKGKKVDEVMERGRVKTVVTVDDGDYGRAAAAAAAAAAAGEQHKSRHRRVPGSFDFSDDEEEWGGM